MKAIFAVFALFIDMYDGFWKEIKSHSSSRVLDSKLMYRETLLGIFLSSGILSLVWCAISMQLIYMWKTQEHRLLLVHQGKAPAKFLLCKCTHGFD